jgi:hypothetical protein
VIKSALSVLSIATGVELKYARATTKTVVVQVELESEGLNPHKEIPEKKASAAPIAVCTKRNLGVVGMVIMDSAFIVMLFGLASKDALDALI